MCMNGRYKTTKKATITAECHQEECTCDDNTTPFTLYGGITKYCKIEMTTAKRDELGVLEGWHLSDGAITDDDLDNCSDDTDCSSEFQAALAKHTAQVQREKDHYTMVVARWNEDIARIEAIPEASR